MEQRYGTDPSRRYGTGVWNGCGPGACSGPPILTCPHILIYIDRDLFPFHPYLRVFAVVPGGQKHGFVDDVALPGFVHEGKQPLVAIAPCPNS